MHGGLAGSRGGIRDGEEGPHEPEGTTNDNEGEQYDDGSTTRTGAMCRSRIEPADTTRATPHRSPPIGNEWLPVRWG